MRRYENLWADLKVKKSLKIEVSRTEHAKIMQGLSKESARDIKTRLLYSEMGKSYLIKHSSIRNTLYINLNERDTVPNGFSKNIP